MEKGGHTANLHIALGSWADEMDSQPLPSAPPSGHSTMGRDGGEKRGFGPAAWERQSSGMGDRAGSSYGMLNLSRP